MKQLIGLFLLLTFSITTSYAANDSITFVTSKFNKVMKQAKDENKLLFVYIGSEHCTVCGRTKEKLNNSGLTAEFNTSFVNYKMDPENLSNNMRLNNWGISKVPTMLFLNKKKDIVFKFEGEPSIDVIKDMVTKAKAIQP